MKQKLRKASRKPQECDREAMDIKKCYDGKLFPNYYDIFSFQIIQNGHMFWNFQQDH